MVHESSSFHEVRHRTQDNEVETVAMFGANRGRKKNSVSFQVLDTGSKAEDGMANFP